MFFIQTSETDPHCEAKFWLVSKRVAISRKIVIIIFLYLIDTITVFHQAIKIENAWPEKSLHIFPRFSHCLLKNSWWTRRNLQYWVVVLLKMLNKKSSSSFYFLHFVWGRWNETLKRMKNKTTKKNGVHETCIS